MKEAKSIVQKLTSSELIELAGVLRIPLTTRKVSRNELIENIQHSISELSERRGPPTALTSPAIKITMMRKEFGAKVAVRGLRMEVNPGEIVGLEAPMAQEKLLHSESLPGSLSRQQEQ